MLGAKRIRVARAVVVAPRNEKVRIWLWGWKRFWPGLRQNVGLLSAQAIPISGIACSELRLDATEAGLDDTRELLENPNWNHLEAGRNYRSMDSPQPDSEVELDVEAEVTDVTPAAAVLDD